MVYGGKAMATEHVGFSSDGKLFALINDQGILRIWDTDSNVLKQEYTPSLHLTGPCTALIWVQVTAAASTPSAKKKKVQKSNTAKQDYIALGTSTGQISLYSYAEGKIVRNLSGEGHAGRVTAIVRGDDDVIYTSGEDCNIISWSLGSQERLSSWSVGPEKPQRIAYLSHSKKLVVGSRQIKVYSVETHELIQTYTGHTVEVNLMSAICLNEGKVEYALTTSIMERIICLWNISKKGNNQSAACTLLMEDIAYLLTCQYDENNGVIRVFSVTRSGVIHMYIIPLNKLESDHPLKPKLTIEIASDSTNVVEPIPAVAVSPDNGKSLDEILIGYGDRRFMMFERIKPTFVEKKQVLVRTNPKTVLQKSTKETSAEAIACTLKTLQPIINPNDVDYKGSISQAPKKKVKETEMPMESRLQNLNIDASPTNVGSQSKVQLLVQSLHSKDPALLDTVLQTSNLKTIELTLQKLPVQYVSPLVNELTTRMQKKRMHVEYSVTWLRVLVQTHSSQLMALGSSELLEKFGPCIGMIEQRAHCLQELSKLSGRLKLIVNQIKRNTEEALDTENVEIYEDEDSSDSEQEDSREESEGEWDENDSECDDDADMDVNGSRNETDDEMAT